MLPPLDRLSLGHKPTTRPDVPRGGASVGCLSYLPPDSAVFHPDCSDTQLLVFESKERVDGESVFKAVQYINISGEFQFLCWPVDHDMLKKYDDKQVYSECIAVDLNELIAQSDQEETMAKYRSFDGPKKPVCSIRASARPDRTLTFAVDLRGVQEDGFEALQLGERSAKVVGELKRAMGELIDTYQQQTGDEAASYVTTLQNAVQGLTYDGVPPESLDKLLSALAQCATAGLSLIVGLSPRDGVNAFVLHFDDLRLQNNAEGIPALKVPLLGLVHEDSFEETPETNSEALHEHLHAVRASYWVASFTTRSTEMLEQIQLPRSAGLAYENILVTSRDNGQETMQRLPSEPRPFKAGRSHSFMLTAGEFSSLHSEDAFAHDRTAAETRIKARFLTPNQERKEKVQSMWPGGQIPDTCKLRATNIALLKIGKTPIASGFLTMAQLASRAYMWHMHNTDAKRVRSRLALLAQEALYEKGTPLPNWTPLNSNSKRPLDDPNDKYRIIRPRLLAAPKAPQAPPNDDDEDAEYYPGGGLQWALGSADGW